MVLELYGIIQISFQVMSPLMRTGVLLYGMSHSAI
jgi:hypothetical protein